MERPGAGVLLSIIDVLRDVASALVLAWFFILTAVGRPRGKTAVSEDRRRSGIVPQQGQSPRFTGWRPERLRIVREALSRLVEMRSRFRQAEQARAQLAAIVESSTDAIIGKTLDGVITSWNRGAAAMYGYGADEVVGKSILLLFPPGREGELEDMLARVRSGEKIEQHEAVRVRKDGSLVDVSVSLSPIVERHGQVVGVATIARDITARKREQVGQGFLLQVGAVLASSLDHESILSEVAGLVVNHMSDWCAIDLVAADGTLQPVVVAHRDPSKVAMAMQLHSHRPGSQEALYCMPRAVQTGQPQLYSEISAPVLKVGSSDRAQLQRLRKAGVASVMIIPMIARGRTVGAIAFVSAEMGRHYDEVDLKLAEELTHRVALAMDNIRLFQDAQTAIRVRDEFLSVASHELRTPITSLHGFAQLALRQLDRGEKLDPERIRQGLQVIDYQSKKLSHLVSQLLDVTAIEGGSLTLDRQMVDVSSLLKRVVSMARTSTNGHDLVLKAPASVQAVVDSPRLEQVMINLIDNAIRYSPSGGLIEIELATPDDESVRFSVRDHGIGIPPEHRAKVFDRLYRGHGIDNFGGMGLGLYIAREVASRHGGEISLEFPEDGGTLCSVTLPSGVRTAVRSKKGEAA